MLNLDGSWITSFVFRTPFLIITAHPVQLALNSGNLIETSCEPAIDRVKSGDFIGFTLEKGTPPRIADGSEPWTERHTSGPH